MDPVVDKFASDVGGSVVEKEVNPVENAAEVWPGAAVRNFDVHCFMSVPRHVALLPHNSRSGNFTRLSMRGNNSRYFVTKEGFAC